jgi:glycosyltransferase involved in cell wall biosynthesis
VRFALFTKTLWHEPPRLRHQVAHMLLRRGHEVDFFEKNFGPAGDGYTEKGAALRRHRHRELLHHQLRVHPLLSRLNAEVEKSEIRRRLQIAPDHVVVNFNYDYYFLRELAPEQRILTVINDDFVAGSRWFARREAGRVLAATAGMSDHTLVVSYPLRDALRPVARDVVLFLPWARRPYSEPRLLGPRDEVLYWGYINERIDVEAVERILGEGIRINFAGPVTWNRQIHALLKHPNATYLGPRKLEDIPEVLERCACSLLAYDASQPMVGAVTISNRAFELMSWGLPLVYTNLPGLLEAPPEVIHRCRTPEEFIAGYHAARAGFAEAQGVIRGFLEAHTEDVRYEALMALVR